MNMSKKCVFYLLSFLVVMSNGLGRFISKSQSQMHVIQRLDEKYANDDVVRYGKPGLTFKVIISKLWQLELKNGIVVTCILIKFILCLNCE